MDKKERQELEYNAIGIAKFIERYFGGQDKKSTSKNKRWRIKHDEILRLGNVISIPNHFIFKYKELVRSGKIIIVRDDYGYNKAYINPQTIEKIYYLPGLESHYNQLKDENIDNNSQSMLRYLEREIADLKEILCLIEKLDKNDYIKQIYHLFDLMDNAKGRIRKKVENDPCL